MSQRSTAPVSLPVNRLIAGLPRAERNGVVARCEPVELAFGEVLCEAGEPYRHIYFPTTGVISLVKNLGDHQFLETEQIGNEGMLGATLILNVISAPQRGFVHGAGTALRMTAAQLQSSLRGNSALLGMLKRYLYVVMLKLSQTTGCNRFHDVGERLARALLIADDRTHADHFHLTHQFLAEMLGVQRGAVTIAAGLLQQQKIIHYTRGEITVLDRDALELAACECYRVIADDYERLLP
ncbi:MAG: Crp/Fnr family transcriptional regulator [Porticoccaceae bacterium]